MSHGGIVDIALPSRDAEVLWMLVQVIGSSIVIPTLCLLVTGQKRRAIAVRGWLCVWAAQSIVVIIAAAWLAVLLAQDLLPANVLAAVVFGVGGTGASIAATVPAAQCGHLGVRVLRAGSLSATSRSLARRIQTRALLVLPGIFTLFVALPFIPIRGRFYEAVFALGVLAPIGLGCVVVIAALGIALTLPPVSRR